VEVIAHTSIKYVGRPMGWELSGVIGMNVEGAESSTGNTANITEDFGSQPVKVGDWAVALLVISKGYQWSKHISLTGAVCMTSDLFDE